jgi:hypothetical protein
MGGSPSSTTSLVGTHGVVILQIPSLSVRPPVSTLAYTISTFSTFTVITFTGVGTGTVVF